MVALAAAVNGAGAQAEPLANRPRYIKPVIDTTPRDSVRDSTTSPMARPRPNCWRAQPLPRCPGFFVTDIGVEVPVYTTRRREPLRSPSGRDFGTRLVWGIGFMRNFGDRAMGPVASITSDNATRGLPWMAEWRYRQWLSATGAVDVGVGYKTSSVWQAGAGELRGRGVTAMVGWTPNRWIGLSARTDLVAARGQTHRAVLLGVESTRSSELLARMIVVELWRALLAKIGVEWEDEEP